MNGTTYRKYLLGAGLCLLLWAPAALAQRYARTLDYLIERPAERGPSSQIGGLYTAAFTPLTATRADVALFGQEQYQFRGRQRSRHLEYRWGERVRPQRVSTGNDVMMQRAPRFGMSMGPGNFGLSANLTAPGPMSFYGGSGYDRSLSGTAAPMGLFLPPPAIPIRYVPSISAYEHTPRPELTPFQRAFGLLPAPREPEGETLKLPAERLNERTDQLAVAAEREGLALFKQGTVEGRDARTGRFLNCLDCADKLAAAVQRLRMARVLDVQAARPVLLLAHALLEQEQSTLAVHHLTEAFAREPALFDADPHELDGYFGDVTAEGETSVLLAAQLRRYRRVAELNPEAPDALVLQAYCAWRLNEIDRARQALDQLDALALGGSKVSAAVLDFATGLRQALP